MLVYHLPKYNTGNKEFLKKICIPRNVGNICESNSLTLLDALLVGNMEINMYKYFLYQNF